MLVAPADGERRAGSAIAGTDADFIYVIVAGDDKVTGHERVRIAMPRVFVTLFDCIVLSQTRPTHRYDALFSSAKWRSQPC